MEVFPLNIYTYRKLDVQRVKLKLVKCRGFRRKISKYGNSLIAPKNMTCIIKTNLIINYEARLKNVD